MLDWIGSSYISLYLNGQQSFVLKFSCVVPSHVHTLYYECTLQVFAISGTKIMITGNSVCPALSALIHSKSLLQTKMSDHSHAMLGYSSKNIMSWFWCVPVFFFFPFCDRYDSSGVKRISYAQILPLTMGGGDPHWPRPLWNSQTEHACTGPTIRPSWVQVF